MSAQPPNPEEEAVPPGMTEVPRGPQKSRVIKARAALKRQGAQARNKSAEPTEAEPQESIPRARSNWLSQQRLSLKDQVQEPRLGLARDFKSGSRTGCAR